MQILQEDDLWIISFNPENKYIQTSWKGKRLSHQDFEVKTEHIIKFTKMLSPKGFFADARLFDYPITPEKQTWHNEKLFPVFAEIGLEKMAILLPIDLFSEVSVSQIYEEAETSFKIQYFNNETEVLQWLGT